MRSNNRKKSRLKLLNEIRDQLILQAERWGKRDYYSAFKLMEIELDQARNIQGELMSERSNLLYELHILGSDKQELLIKLERLEMYLKRAAKVIDRQEKYLVKSIEKIIKQKDELKTLLAKMRPENNISVLISSN